jgi:hypothetical protein
MKYEFDAGVDYLRQLLKSCDASVLADCINIAAHARNTTDLPSRIKFKYATPSEGREITLSQEFVPISKYDCVLPDNDSDFDTKLPVTVKFHNGFLHICPQGYGESHAPKGEGSPVFLEVYEGELRVIIYPNINSDSEQQIISLEGTREDLAKDRDK